MKRLWYALAAVMASVMTVGMTLVMTSCQNEENFDNNNQVISEQAKASFDARYPGAANVTWQSKGNYVIARFLLRGARSADNGCDMSAWFDNGGVWYMTETDIPFSMLPEAVQTAFNASEYASWTIDDVDKLERNGVEVVYVIEVTNIENGHKTEIDLYYSADGVLVKKIADAGAGYDYEDYIPSKPSVSIEDYIRANYPGARIVDIDYEHGMTEVEIIDGRVCRELLFDGSGVWQYTKTEVYAHEVPAAVSTALASSQYAGYYIDDIDHYVTTDSEFYRYDLESINGDIEVDITLDGSLTVVQPGSGKPGQGNGQMIGATIAEFISTKYPGARILEYDYDDGLIEVEIWHDNREKDVYFNGANAWVYTEWDIRRHELPKAVSDAIAASQWASFSIDDIEYVQTPDREFYLVELERGKQEVELRIDATGKIF